MPETHVCCACFTHNGLPCCNEGHPVLTGDEQRMLWDAVVGNGATRSRLHRAVETIIVRHKQTGE